MQIWSYRKLWNNQSLKSFSWYFSGRAWNQPNVMLISVVIYPDLVDEVSQCWRWLIMEINANLFLNAGHSPPQPLHEGQRDAPTVAHDVTLVMQLQSHLSLIVWQAQNVYLWCSLKLQLVRLNLLSFRLADVCGSREHGCRAVGTWRLSLLTEICLSHHVTSFGLPILFDGEPQTVVMTCDHHSCSPSSMSQHFRVDDPT